MDLFKKWWFWVIIVLVYVIIGQMVVMNLLSDTLVQLSGTLGAENLMDPNVRGNLLVGVLLWPLLLF